jgi:hypothetical protein
MMTRFLQLAERLGKGMLLWQGPEIVTANDSPSSPCITTRAIA